MNMQPAAVCFDLSVSVQRLLLEHRHREIRYVAKNMVSQSRSNIIMQHLSGSRSMFLAPEKTHRPPRVYRKMENFLWSI